jgi:Mg2+ and Co2+ transporter CorA
MAIQGETRTRAPKVPPTDLLEATLWRPGQEPSRLDLDAPGFDGGIAWFEVQSDGNADELFAFLAPRCQGLTREMVSDLLEPDRRPQGERWGEGEFRLASTFSVHPTETKNDRGDWSCPVPSADLLYQPVELLSNGDWLLTCWHPAEVYRGFKRLGEPRPPVDHHEVCHGVKKRWLTKPPDGTAADLGILIMHELALTYAPAHRQLYAALEEWELGLYGDVDGDLTELQADPQVLRDLWSARARLLDWLGPLNVPGLNQDPAEKAWLPATDAEEVNAVDRRVDKALDALKSLGEALRSSFHSLQLLAAEAQRDRNEQRQRRIELMAALFLIPTLIVGFYGANTWVPGEQRHWGLWVMLVAIAAFTLLGWTLIKLLHSRDDFALPKLSWRGRSDRTGRN